MVGATCSESVVDSFPSKRHTARVRVKWAMRAAMRGCAGAVDEEDDFESWLSRHPPPKRSVGAPAAPSRRPSRVERVPWPSLRAKLAPRGWSWDTERRLFVKMDGSCELIPPRALPPPWCASGGEAGWRFGDFFQALQEAELEGAVGMQFVALLASESSAMAVFRGDGVAMRHRVITAYTVRKGQGGAQALRSGKQQSRSAGARLRAQEATKLAKKTAETFQEWAQDIQACEVLVRSGDVRLWNAVYDVREQRGKIVDRNDERWQPAGIGVPRPRYKDLEKVFRESLVAEIRNYREEEAELDSE